MREITFFDFKSSVDLGHTFSTLIRKGVAYVYGTDGLLSGDGFPTQARVQQMRGSVSRQL